jgi:hypothetical protein
VASGALTLTTNYLAQSVAGIGMGGYAYAYNDGMSTACINPSALCGMGSTVTMDAMGKNWGAGIGFNLNQMMATSSASPQINPFTATGSGISYTLSSFASAGGMRVIVDQGGTDYCAPITSAMGTVKWSSFNTKCWDNSGTMLSGAPMATHINFQVNSATSGPASFNFCVTAVSFAP